MMEICWINNFSCWSEVISSDEDIFNYVKRAEKLRKGIEWLLDDNKDMEIKWAAWFLTHKYRRELLMIIEQVIPHFVIENKESHPEFSLFGDMVNKLRINIASL